MVGTGFSVYRKWPRDRRLSRSLYRTPVTWTSEYGHSWRLCLRYPEKPRTCFKSFQNFPPDQNSASRRSGYCSGCLPWTKKAPGVCDHRRWCTLPRCCSSERTSSCWWYPYHRDCKHCRCTGTANPSDYPPVYGNLSGRYHHTGNRKLYKFFDLFV
jgi:spore_YyaC: putative sporulation protein YyaC